MECLGINVRFLSRVWSSHIYGLAMSIDSQEFVVPGIGTCDLGVQDSHA